MFMGCIVVGYAHAQEVGVCVDWSIFVGRLARRASSFVSLDIYPHPTSWFCIHTHTYSHSCSIYPHCRLWP